MPGKVAVAQTAPQLLPYTAKLLAGGSSTVYTGTPRAACSRTNGSGTVSSSGNTATDAYGDGCLATEISLTGPRYAIADTNGNVFFSDYTNGLVRRIDATTGVVTAVAGGATASPAAGAACGALTSANSRGDGCLGTAVKLSKPVGLVFAANGDLYFADNGNDNVRKVAATAGQITTTGIITTIVGNAANTYGYNVNNTSTSGPVVAATNGYLNFPYGLALDKAGNLYIADEGSGAVEVVNMGPTTTTIQGISVPAGTIAKLAGYGSASGNTQSPKSTTIDCPDFISTSSRGGCYFGKFVDGAVAVSSLLDNPYSVALDASNNLYIANEFNQNIPRVSSDGLIHMFVGDQGAGKKTTQRGVAGNYDVGSQFGVAADALNNVYFTDALNGVVWRVDAAGKFMYVVAGGASTPCSTVVDAYGDGCPATQATFGATGTSFATTASPGIFGVSVDANANLYVGDTITNVVREVASGTQFGSIGASQTDNIAIHFAAGDGPLSAGAFTITSGSSIFTIGTPTSTVNSDNTTDYIVPVTAAPTASGAFSGTLTVKSNQVPAGTSFALTGNFVQSPVTRTVVTTSSAAGCAGNNYPTTSPVTLTATLVANGPFAPAGTVSFYSNGTQIGTAQNVTNIGTTGNPVYGATLSYTFTTAATYAITATYTPAVGSYFMGSTSGPAPVVAAAPSFAGTVGNQENTVTAGGTALYEFSLAQVLYGGTISFSCSGLPANSSCSFSPPVLTATGCSTTTTVAMSINTQQGGPIKQASMSGSARWQMLAACSGFAFLALLGMRRRKSAAGLTRIAALLALLVAVSGFAACGNGGQSSPATPSGTSTVLVTATGSTGFVSTFTVQLTVK